LAEAIKDEMRATYPAEGATQVQRRIGFPARPETDPQS
jgi:hypothetical protein